MAIPIASGHTSLIIKSMACDAAFSSSLMQLLEYDMIVLPFKNDFLRFKNNESNRAGAIGIDPPLVAATQSAWDLVKNPLVPLIPRSCQ